MRKNFARKGFTLIELMIVVAIIGILAAIAIPNFIRYQLKSKQSEAKTVMGGLKTSEESFRAEFDDYVGNVVACNPAACAPDASKQAWTLVACNANCGRGANLANCNSFECIGYRPAGPVYAAYQVAANVNPVIPDFHAGAVLDLDTDGTQNCWQYCTDGSNVGAAACPAAAPANVAGCAGVAVVVGEITNTQPDQF